jgi:hypothetical protein
MRSTESRNVLSLSVFHGITPFHVGAVVSAFLLTSVVLILLNRAILRRFRRSHRTE